MKDEANQREHQIVLKNILTMLNSKYGAPRIVTGSDAQNGFVLNGHVPDILLLTEDGKPKSIYEIETTRSIKTADSHKRWIAFAELELPLYLVVPQESASGVRMIIYAYDLEQRIENVFYY